MQRRDRRQVTELIEYRMIEDGRFGESLPAVDDTMADDDDPIHQAAPANLGNRRQHRIAGRHRTDAKGPFAICLAGRADLQTGFATKLGDAALEQQRQLRPTFVDGELEAG